MPCQPCCLPTRSVGDKEMTADRITASEWIEQGSVGVCRDVDTMAETLEHIQQILGIYKEEAETVGLLLS